RRSMGLRELMDRMRNMRSEQLNRYNMASVVMDDLREKLEEIKNLEREGIQSRLDEKQEPSSGQSQDGQQTSDQQGQQQSGGQQQPSDQQGQQQSGQSGQSGEGGDSDLTPEQKRKMLEMIAKR